MIIQNIFTVKPIYKRTSQKKFQLKKFDHVDGSISYRLTNMTGAIVFDHILYDKGHYHEYKEHFHDLKDSVFGDELDKELTETQESWKALVEEILIRI